MQLIDMALESCLLKEKCDVYLPDPTAPYDGDEKSDVHLLDSIDEYEVTTTIALSPDTGVSVTLVTCNSWVMMQRKITGGSVSFRQNWTEYRDGFGSATSGDNYWLGLEKVYVFQQLGSVSLRVEVHDGFRNESNVVAVNSPRSFSIASSIIIFLDTHASLLYTETHIGGIFHDMLETHITKALRQNDIR